MTAQQIADANLAKSMTAAGLINEGGVWYTPAQILNRRTQGAVAPPSPGTIVNPANEPPWQPPQNPMVPDVAPLLYPTSISAPAPISAPPTIPTGTSNQDYGETQTNVGSGETSVAGKDGGGDGGKEKRHGYYREPWDNVARRNPRKKGTGKKDRRKKRKK